MRNFEVAYNWVDQMLKGKMNHDAYCGHNFYGIENYLVSYTRPICEYNNFVFSCLKKSTIDSITKNHFMLLKKALDFLLVDPIYKVELVDKMKVKEILFKNFK